MSDKNPPSPLDCLCELLAKHNPYTAGQPTDMDVHLHDPAPGDENNDQCKTMEWEQDGGYPGDWTFKGQPQKISSLCWPTRGLGSIGGLALPCRRSGEVGTVIGPNSGCSTSCSMPRSCMCRSCMTSGAVRTGAHGTRFALARANTSIFGRVRVHSVTTASVSSICAMRSALVLKRGSSANSSRPIVFNRLRQCPSVTMWIAACPSAQR